MGRFPSSTYRLQLRTEFDFDKASSVALYLNELGLSHVYLSPCLQAARGSSSGYDVTDFKAISKDLGGPAAHERLCLELNRVRLGQVVDIVPNHMSLTHDNPYWRDVLENGPDSRFASYFDLDWEVGESRIGTQFLLPILGEQYGIALRNRAIKLQRTEARFQVVYYDHHLPVAPKSMCYILSAAASAAGSDRLAFLADSFDRLNHRERGDDSYVLKQQRDRRVLFGLLADVLESDGKLSAAIDKALDSIESNSGALDRLLQQQHYRLAYWKAADQDLGYRRFFDVNSLIGMRVERESVFRDTHELILDWLDRGVIDGVRVDHADGLRDPQQYFERLRQRAPNAWIVAEKILARDEALPDSWPVDGTTGYEFLNLVNGLLVSPEGLGRLGDFYAELIGKTTDLPELVHSKKVAVTAEALGSDVNWITSLFLDICESDMDHRDYTRFQVRHALREVACCFSVYRSYVSPARENINKFDCSVIELAIADATRHRPDIDQGLFDFIADVLLLRKRGVRESEFLLRFQQFTSPVMAKGFEDTALYCFHRLAGMNDVGSTLTNPIVSIDDFHRANHKVQMSHPGTMLTLSTHDTKRGEDVRARLLVLSEVPDEFEKNVQKWFEWNQRYGGEGIPDVNTEYLYYQTLIGAWPISEGRAVEYMLKAAREAKEQTSWVSNNIRFEEGMSEFIQKTLADERFCAMVGAFVDRIKQAGFINSLTQTLLKCTSPGVPDTYQGSELWDLRLVDPDNRTPVDYDLRKKFLKELAGMTADQILSRMEDGLPKLFVLKRALETRRMLADCFDERGDYTPYMAQGERAQNIVAFLRGARAITVAPRLTASFTEWGDTFLTIPQGSWTEVFTGQRFDGGELSISSLLSRFPVALLTKGI